MAFQREKQNVTASQLLQVIADGDQIQLSQCTITGSLNINRLWDPAEKFHIEDLAITKKEDRTDLILPQSIVFDKCTFEENVVFTAPWAQPDSVSVEFKSDVIFSSSVFKAQARFRGAIFNGIAGFDGCTFNGIATIKNAVFKKDAKFRTAAFDGYFLAGSAVFDSSVRFTNTHFAKGANFTKARFSGIADFSGVYSSSRAVPTYEGIFFAKHRYGQGESFWRFVKQSAQEAGYYQLAGECFYNERCARLWQKFRGHEYQLLSTGGKIVRAVKALKFLPEFIFGKLLFGYGERPTRVLVASAVVILICAFIYAQPGLLIYRETAESLKPSFLEGLYFSMITFTTLGYGDLYPNPDGFCRLIAMTEALAGGFLMALFVVCLAKRFSRG